MSCSKGGVKKSFYHNLVNTLSILLRISAWLNETKLFWPIKFPIFLQRGTMVFTGALLKYEIRTKRSGGL